MILTSVLQAIGLFAATNIDDIIVLSLFFARGAGQRGTTARILAGQYLGFAGILGAAALGSPLADSLSEAEPFKTAITLYFVRAWPFVAYALGLLVLNLFVYKGFCRYLCPLGASLAVLGRLRLLDWIPRRAECGSPCQLCKVRCRYGAIRPSGRVDYPECFQCMDCVTIIHDPGQCVPEVVARRRGKRIVPQPVAAE